MFFSRFILTGASCSVLLLAGIANAQAPVQPEPARSQRSTPSRPDPSNPARSNPTQEHSTQQDISRSRGSANRANLSAPDEKFIMNAAKGGHEEVEMGRMGVEKATNKSVKEFAQRMVDDHTKANNELEALAKQKGISLPSSYPKDPAENKLSKASGASFDHEYMNTMVTDHQKDVSEFEKEASSGADPDIKSWAAKTLPTLRSHLDQAKSIKP